MPILCYRFLSCYRFFLTVLLLYASCTPIAFSCESAFSPAGQEFINFAREHLPEGKRFGGMWEQRISEATNPRWKPEDVGKFLKEMKKRIGVEDTLKMIQSTTYFFRMDYASFTEMVGLYEAYLGAAGVNQHLRTRLNGFHRGNVKEIKAIIAYLKRYFGVEASKSTIQAMMRSSLSSAYTVNLSRLEAAVEYLKEYIVGANPRFTIQALMESNFESFYKANLSRLKEVVEYLEGYIVGANPRSTIKEMMEKSFIAFSRANLRELEKVVKYVESLIGKEKVKAKLQADLHSFSSITLAQLKKLEKKLGPEKMRQSLEMYNLQYLLLR